MYFFNMKALIIVALFLGYASGQPFNPSITVTCFPAPEYSIAVTDCVSGAIILISDTCAAQTCTGTTQTFTFNDAACSLGGGAPAIGTEFLLLMQGQPTLTSSADLKAFEVTCTAQPTDSHVEFVDFQTLPGNENPVTVNEDIEPTFIIQFEAANVGVITSATFGDTIRLTVEIGSEFEDDFGFRIQNLRVLQGSENIEVISGGCSNFPDIVPHPPKPSSTTHVLTLEFAAFYVTSQGIPTAAVPLRFRVRLHICNPKSSTCPRLPNCSGSGRKKRQLSTTNTNTEQTVEVQSPILEVFPPGQRAPSSQSQGVSQVETTDCPSNMPYIAGIIALAAVLLFVALIAAWAIYRYRRVNDKLKYGPEPRSNPGYRY